MATKEGWLVKKAVRTASKMNWKKRWIKLHNKQITYAKSQSGKAIMALPLTKASTVRVCSLHHPNELEVVLEMYTFYAYSVAPNAAEEVEAWRAAIQEAIDELNPEAVAARKAKERVSEEIARKKDLTWRREEDKWDETRGMLGADATPSHLLTPMQRRLRQQLAEGMASGNLDFLAIVMAARSMVGRAYAWGSNDQGEAGIGRLAPAGMTGPAQIESLRRLHAPVFLAAGSKHAAALTGESQLFVWGRNMEGQCALGPKAKRSMRPYLVKGLKSFQVTHVACGHTHTVAVVSTGEAFAWGSSDSGALGIGPPTEEDEEAATKAAARGEDTSGEIVMTRHEPVRMVDIGPDFGRHAALVTAGRSTTAVQTAQGECLVCGSNSTGQLGFGIDQLGLTFHEVRPARLEGYSHIQQVELGDTFSAFVVDDGVLLLTGVLGVTPEEFAERRKETAWLIDNCDAPSPRTLFMERPLVRCIATSGEHLVVVCKYTDQHFAGGVVGNPSAPVATGSGDAAEPGVEELPPNDEQLFHVYTAGRGYLGCKPDHPDLTLLKNAGGVEVHLPDGSKALRDAVGEVVTPGFGWSPRLVPVPALQGQDIDEVACGDRFTLARTRDGRVFAWGDNDNGQLGNGCYINTDEPMEASEVDMGNTHSEQVVAGGDFAMTLQFDGCKGFKQERYLSRKYGMLWMDKVFGADRHKRHGVADQFDRDFGGEMAAAVQEYADDQGISDVLGDATLMSLIGATTRQEQQHDMHHGDAAE